MAVCQLVALMIHLPLIYILMWPMQLGYLGAAISTSVAWCACLHTCLLPACMHTLMPCPYLPAGG